MNYLWETLKKYWKFGENFWEILDWLGRSILNIFVKSRKIRKKLLEKFWSKVNLGKLWGNIGVILYYWFCGNYKAIWKMFLWNCEENSKKRGEYFIKIFKYFDGNFVTFSSQVLEKLIKNYCKNMKNTLWILFPSRMQLSCVHLDSTKDLTASNRLRFQLL